jgi:phage tail protein X
MSEEDRAKADQLVHVRSSTACHHCAISGSRYRAKGGLTRFRPCQHFYAKTVAVISQARGAEAGPTASTPPVAAATDDTGRRRTVSGATKTKRSNKWVGRQSNTYDLE